MPEVRKLAGLPRQAPLKDAVESVPVQQHFRKAADGLAAMAIGSATRVASLHLTHGPPSINRAKSPTGLHQPALFAAPRPAGESA